MHTVTGNMVVYLVYTIRDQQGELFEQYDLPVGYVHGVNGPLFAKIEHALEGKSVGERVEVTLSPADGFGEHKPELTFTDDIRQSTAGWARKSRSRMNAAKKFSYG
jgi:FKBP-type peptidyl-prolyl cis-trans isomerase SlyD